MVVTNSIANCHYWTIQGYPRLSKVFKRNVYDEKPVANLGLYIELSKITEAHVMFEFMLKKAWITAWEYSLEQKNCSFWVLAMPSL